MTACCGPRSNKPDCSASVYGNKDRIIEPHDYGQHNGVIKLLTWQIGGSSSHPLPNWRWMETDLISDAQLLAQTFSGGRPAPSGKHHKCAGLNRPLSVLYTALLKTHECPFGKPA